MSADDKRCRPLGPDRPEYCVPMHVIRGTVVTMNPGREIITNGAIGIDGTAITHVDTFDAVQWQLPDAPVSGTATDLLLPGYINGHQHLTGDRLIQSSIPDDLAPGEAIFTWVIPVHAEHTGDDDELSATLTLAESLSNGITTTFEAGTVAHPDRIAHAAERVGARLTIGTWGWDIEHGPFTGSVDEVIGRQTAALDLATGPTRLELGQPRRPRPHVGRTCRRRHRRSHASGTSA